MAGSGKAKGGKKGRKIKRNELKCAAYRSRGQRERNKRSKEISRLRGMRSEWAQRRLAELGVK